MSAKFIAFPKKKKNVLTLENDLKNQQEKRKYFELSFTPSDTLRLFCPLNRQTKMCKLCDNMFVVCLTRKLLFVPHVVCILAPYLY